MSTHRAAVYRYSHPYDPPESEGVTRLSKFPLRLSNYADLAVDASKEFLEQWSAVNGQCRSNGAMYRISWNPTGHSLLALAMPECLPDRMAILTKLTDMAFLRDDIDDLADTADGTANSEQEISAEVANQISIPPGTLLKDLRDRTKQCRDDIAQTLLRIDRELGASLLEAWKGLTEAEKSLPEKFDSFDEYSACRASHAGARLYQEMCCFGMGIRMSAEEKHSLQDVLEPCYIMLGLANDLYSWAAEKKTAEGSPPDTDVVNGVDVLKKLRMMTESEAQAFLREKIEALQDEYLRRVDVLEANTTLSAEGQRYLSAAESVCAGAIFWFSSAPRYKRSIGDVEKQ